MFIVKSNEWNYSYGIEMVQSIYMQYMIRYFIKFGNDLDGFKNICSLCNILLQVIYSYELNIYILINLYI